MIWLDQAVKFKRIYIFEVLFLLLKSSMILSFPANVGKPIRNVCFQYSEATTQKKSSEKK